MGALHTRKSTANARWPESASPRQPGAPTLGVASTAAGWGAHGVESHDRPASWEEKRTGQESDDQLEGVWSPTGVDVLASAACEDIRQNVLGWTGNAG